MRFCLAFFIFISVATIATAQSALRNLERVTISHAEYVRVKSWCAAMGMDGKWIKHEEELLVSNKWVKLNFTVNSIKARVNGMDVRLSLPIVLRSGVPWISWVDVQHTLHPLLAPPRNASGDKVTTICIDAGHGGKDKGKIDRFHYEKTQTLLLASELTKLLKEAGFKVVNTRTRDVYVELSDRAAVANRAGADVFLSLHYNAFHVRSVRGVETYCMTPAGVESSNSGPGTSSAGSSPGNTHNARNMLLAFNIQRSLVRSLGLEDRGVKRARYQVLTGLKMPGVLIEAGFMSNPDEAKKIYDPAYRKKTAKAILDGVIAYKKIVENNTSSTAK